jgi:hypothetical protein
LELDSLAPSAFNCNWSESSLDATLWNVSPQKKKLAFEGRSNT